MKLCWDLLTREKVNQHNSETVYMSLSKICLWLIGRQVCSSYNDILVDGNNRGAFHSTGNTSADMGIVKRINNKGTTLGLPKRNMPKDFV